MKTLLFLFTFMLFIGCERTKVHPWAKEPYENILDRINKTYILKTTYTSGKYLYDVCSRKNDKQIKWNIEDVNMIKNDIMKFLKIEPEKDEISISWSTITYKIEVYCSGDNNIRIRLDKN